VACKEIALVRISPKYVAFFWSEIVDEIFEHIYGDTHKLKLRALEGRPLGIMHVLA